MTRVHVVGAAGYAAAELIRLARRHPFIELGALESRSHAGARIGDHAPALAHARARLRSARRRAAALADGDVVVLAGGADADRATAETFARRGARVIDLSDAFRLHAHAGAAVYGFPERYATRSVRRRSSPIRAVTRPRRCLRCGRSRRCR